MNGTQTDGGAGPSDRQGGGMAHLTLSPPFTDTQRGEGTYSRSHSTQGPPEPGVWELQEPDRQTSKFIDTQTRHTRPT